MHDVDVVSDACYAALTALIVQCPFMVLHGVAAGMQGMMKTEAGRKRAKQRHEFMQAFLQEFMLEWDAHA